jgi:hypothetical protein
MGKPHPLARLPTVAPGTFTFVAEKSSGFKLSLNKQTLITHLIIRVIVIRSCVYVGCKLTNRFGKDHDVVEMLRRFGCTRPWILFYDM